MYDYVERQECERDLVKIIFEVIYLQLNLLMDVVMGVFVYEDSIDFLKVLLGFFFEDFIMRIRF